MRKVIFSMGVSLDGYIEDRNREIDWSGPDDELHQFHNDHVRAAGAQLYGRRLYELMAEFWPTADEDPAVTPIVAEFARIWRESPKVVFSTTLEKVEWNSRLVRDDVAAEVMRLKEEPGEGDLLAGGPTLAGSLQRLGLIDEYWLFVYPVLLGGGTPYFPTMDKRVPLRLAETRTFDASGVVHLRYEVRR
jgi:dihydrofolate reductase